MIRRVTSVALAVGIMMATQAPQYAFANGAAFSNDPGAVAENATLYFGIVKDEKAPRLSGRL